MAKVSVSQIETFKACNRKWWWERVMRQGAAERPNIFGVVLHACIERELRGKDPFESGWECAYDRYTKAETGRLTYNEQAQIRMLLNKARDAGWLEYDPGIKIEHEFSIPIGEDTLIGFIDLVRPNRKPLESPREHLELMPTVEDHKSTSDMKWAETEATLFDNTQLLVYAKAVHPDEEWVVLRHNVYCKRPESIKRVQVTVNRMRIVEEWEDVVKTVGEMRAARSVKDKEQLEGNFRECNNWGGCPFKDKCFPGEDY